MAASDLLGTIEAMNILGLGTADAAASTAKGTLLRMAITAVSNRLQQSVGTIVYGTVTGELHDGGAGHVYLNCTPVASIIAVVEYDSTVAGTLTAESNSSQPASGYVFNPTNGKLSRRDSGIDGLFPNGFGNVYVTYVAGRCASTATVDDRYKEAAAIMLKNVWRTYENSATQVNEFDVPIAQFPRFAIPNAVKELLGDQWRTGSGIGD